LIEKNYSRRRLGIMTDRSLKKKLHRMMPIEHFLTDIMQISFTNWIENSLADIGRVVAPTDIFQATFHNFFFKNARWPIMFFYGRGSFLLWCCLKNLQCTSARFFRASATDVLFRPKLPCFHLFGQEIISPSRQKNIIRRYWSKKMTVDVGLWWESRNWPNTG